MFTAQADDGVLTCACIHSHMTTLSLRDAAERVGVHRTSLLRSIKTGRLSATRTESGGYRGDGAGLFRAFPPLSPNPERSDSDSQPTSQPPTQASAQETTAGSSEGVRVAVLEGEVKALASQVQLLQRMLEDVQAQRDKWSARPSGWRWLRLGRPRPCDGD